eukprot:CAMPEP_0119008742 /NCGR_PEP_ID=MMETSP1176-20130426/3903_1 /TAXON_ID=265551 /ORGANISM="Synedropsis recta cf, Strain CCMP1620" /LENGTH=39 /DNA_ID= /DNA_START= /DNA_END= /DNA_ORIENTATION=
MEMWAELAEDNDGNFKEEFIKVFSNPDVKEPDDAFTSDS